MVAQLKPPWELRKLDALLYEFLVAPDREGFAEAHQIFFRDGKVRIYIVTVHDISQGTRDLLIKTYHVQIEKESPNLLRAIVPVDELTSLAKEAIIQSIRLPERPVVQ